MKVSAVLAMGLLGVATAFVPQPAPPTQRTLVSSPMNAFSFLTAPKSKTTAAPSPRIGEIKQEIVRLSKGKDNGLAVKPEDKEQILKLATELAKYNKVKSIARSQATDGDWELVYTSNKGSSAGKIGPFVGEVIQSIDVAATQYVNYVRLGGGAVEGALTATWDVLGDNKWKVIFQDITFKLLGFPLVNKPFLNQTGIWRLTYVDDDIRVLYAAGVTNEGKPARTENIYILRRVNKK